jgi:tRNA-dihydrouridine synthase
MSNVLNSLAKPFFILAPMDDVTDTVFRQVIAKCAKPDLFFTEFVNVDGLQSRGKDKVRTKLNHTDIDQPLIAQIWGLNPENYKLSTEEIAAGVYGDFAGIDINMGCPVKDVVSNGACSGLMNNWPLAQEIIQATKKGAKSKLPISVKTRLGFNEIDPSWHEFLLNQGLDMLIIHGRTKTEMSKVPANWQTIGEIRKLRDKISPKTLIVGNGDVLSREQAEKLAKEYKLDGIMIGRGVFNDPYIFSKNSPWQDITKEQKLDLFKYHVELFHKTWGSTRPIKILNKFCKVYVNNFEGAGKVREKLMAAKDFNELLSIIDKQIAGHIAPGWNYFGSKSSAMHGSSPSTHAS